ncbi:Protein CBG13760 [Caenorhabditis briggsae]|uniref:Tyr recombinase domain-containing protein n=2 Tax=Caenorhabditis briggsae TaxID=6238 RepID=A0AAE9ACB6_CAEBR|nr:Protein CBG13760 [Caenorhabditis briggsae]ULT93287.1 hypothetical protein L3Y34_003045 [Caenorhabditis briggsae]CAP32501.1 Protein CBG13760 [Caenorhabditis briggsae]
MLKPLVPSWLTKEQMQREHVGCVRPIFQLTRNRRFCTWHTNHNPRGVELWRRFRQRNVLTGGSFSPMERQLSGDLMKSKKREEVALRQKPKMVDLSVIKKLFEGPSNNPKSERDVLVIALSFFALLRAGEAAELKWEDVERNGGLLKITIKKAKNDQHGLGRNTFVACPEGEDLDCLLNRWKVRCSTGKYSSEYLFPNLQNGTQLKPNAISTITRKRLGEAGVTATHHALRRGSANEREFRGLSIEEIKARGR